MGPELIPLAVAAAGAYAQHRGDQMAADDRRGVLNRQLDRTQKTQDQASQMVLDEGQNLNPAQRALDMQAQAEANYTQSQKDLTGAHTGAGADLIGGQPTARVSDDYRAAQTAVGATEGDRLSAIARELSKVRAPGQVGASEAQRRAQLSQTTGSLWGTNQNYDRAAQLEANSIDSPWWGKAGGLAKQAGLAYALGGAGGAGGAGGGAGTAVSGNGMAYTA
jgi:hypothetical protein